MPHISVKLGPGATPIFTSANLPAWANPTRNYATVQNNAKHDCAVGGRDVTLTTGILIPSASGAKAGGYYTMPGNIFLDQRYIVGTPNDVITVEFD